VLRLLKQALERSAKPSAAHNGGLFGQALSLPPFIRGHQVAVGQWSACDAVQLLFRH
jgi:hypothetical protein